ncbi:hypothetical protein ACDX78_10305 [Virgibacillus oceani]
MPKYKVLKGFRDTHTKKIYVKNNEIELSEERANEVKNNLKGKGDFIELIPTEEPAEEKFDREAAKEKLTELDVDFKGNASNETLQQLLEESEQQNEKVEEGE